MLKVAAPAVSANTTPAGGAAASPVPRDMDSVPAQPAAAADKPAAEAPSRTFSGPPKPEVTASGHIIVYDALGQPIKRKRPQSCDACRTRKIKCVRLQIEGLENSKDQRCVQCRAIDAQCRFDYIPKRPGPQSSIAKTMKREAEKAAAAAAAKKAGAAGAEPGVAGKQEPIDVAMEGAPARREGSSSSIAPSAGADEASTAAGPSRLPAGGSTVAPGFGMPPTSGSELRSGLVVPGQTWDFMPGANPGGNALPSWAGAADATMGFDGYTPATSAFFVSSHEGPSSGATSPRPHKRARHLGKVFAAPIERPRCLEDVAPRQTFLTVIALYYQNLWPIMPIVHRPTFSFDLVNRRDAEDETFLAFVLSLTAYTLVQAPRSVIPAPWSFYRKLHRICHLTSRRMQPRTYDPPRLLHITTLYCDHIYLSSVGSQPAANAVLGEAIRVSFTLGINDMRRWVPTDGTEGPDLIERELRARVYFLLYGSDKTLAILQDAQPIGLRDDDSWVALPTACKEDLLTAHALLPQTNPERGPPLLSGFVAVSKLYLVLSEHIESLRADRRRPPQSWQATQERLAHIQRLSEKVKALQAEWPDVLKSSSAPLSQQMQMQRNGSRSDELPHFPPPEQPRMAALSSVPIGLPFSPWPTNTFDERGLPNPDITSQPSSGQGSPRMGHAPAPLALLPEDAWSCELPAGTTPHNIRLGPAPSAAQLSLATSQVEAFRPTPAEEPEAPESLSLWATMRANILITVCMIRFVSSERVEFLDSLQAQFSGVKQQSSSADDWQAASRDMLGAFHGIPLESLAANGQSMIAKLLYLVSSLLNRSSSGSHAYDYLSNFLETLSRLTSDREKGNEGSDASSSDDEYAEY